GAHRRGKPLVTELARTAAAPRGVLAHPAIDLRGRDAGREPRPDEGQCPCGRAPCPPERRLLRGAEDLHAHAASMRRTAARDPIPFRYDSFEALKEDRKAARNWI